MLIFDVCVLDLMKTTLIIAVEQVGYFVNVADGFIHEDCVEDVVNDSDGVERYCSFCVDKYTI